jgi:hypothetical protein
MQYENSNVLRMKLPSKPRYGISMKYLKYSECQPSKLMRDLQEEHATGANVTAENCGRQSTVIKSDGGQNACFRKCRACREPREPLKY